MCIRDSFCNIVRDADKLDILHTVSLSDVDTILGVSLDALRQSRLSSSVLEAFDGCLLYTS